jgi:aspartate kinase
MIVHKFGGTSVGCARRFASVVDIVLRHHGLASQGSEAGGPAQPCAIVVSAMDGVTDRLIAGARAASDGRDIVYRKIKADLLSRHLTVVEELLDDSRDRLKVAGFIEDQLHELERLYRSIAVLGELTARGRDVVASFGEQLSAHILAALLRARGGHARAISSTELIVTDDRFGEAAPLMERTRHRLQQQVRPLIERGLLPVITGTIGATQDGITTTLGRGGSDFSAAVIAAGLDADEVWIWSDVDGILTADPNIVPQARTLTELSYAEASDLAYVGAEVLHPKTIRPLVPRSIPLRILNSFNPRHPGTLIVESPSADREVLPAIISTTGLTMIAIGGRDDSWTLRTAARVLQRLSEVGLDVLMFSQSLSEHNLNLVVREKDQSHCLRILDCEFANHHQDNAFHLGVKEKVATVSVVGMPGWSGRRNGIASDAFAALGECEARVIAVAQAATGRGRSAQGSVSFCIPEDQLADTVRFLHRELGLEDGQPHRTQRGTGATEDDP